MLRRPRPLLARRRDGRWDLRLEEPERALLASLATQLTLLGEESPDDPSLRRLHPTAYLADAERDAAWQLLMGEELREARSAQLATLAATADRTELDDDEAQRWMQALNAVRLVLGTRLDVSEDDPGELDPSDPDATPLAVYHLLGYLLERTVDALARAL